MLPETWEKFMLFHGSQPPRWDVTPHVALHLYPVIIVEGVVLLVGSHIRKAGRSFCSSHITINYELWRSGCRWDSVSLILVMLFNDSWKHKVIFLNVFSITTMERTFFVLKIKTSLSRTLFSSFLSFKKVLKMFIRSVFSLGVLRNL